jgi:hypothetical protein
MPVRRIEANPRVDADRGLLAMARGPLVYCIEGVEIDTPFWSFAIGADAKIEPAKRSDLFGGVTVLTGEATVAAVPEWPRQTALYRSAQPQHKPTFIAIPYCFCVCRDESPMRVWMPTSPSDGSWPTLPCRSVSPCSSSATWPASATCSSPSSASSPASTR